MPIDTDDTPNEDQTHANDGTDAVPTDHHGAGESDGQNADTRTDQQKEEAQQQSDVDAFQKGVDSLKADGDASTEAKKGAAAAKPVDDGKRPSAENPAADAAAKDQAGAKQPDADLEKEISGLALKGKAAERFREMAGEIKTARPMMDTLKGLNVADSGTLHTILKDAAAGLQWEQAVMDSTAKPEQLSSALQVIKAMNSGDPKMQGMALDALLGEVKHVAERLGREIPGITGDALDKHADLKAAVEALDITREHALELARSRAMQNRYDERDSALRQNAQQQEQQRQAAAAETQQIDELSQMLAATDPHFQAKLASMKASGSFAQINALPVGQKYAAIMQAYRAIPAPAPAPTSAARVRPGLVTNRGNNTSGPGVARNQFKDDLEAFQFGVDSVSHHG